MKTGVGLILLCALVACGPRVSRVTAPTSYQQAQTATAGELVELINQRYAAIDSLKAARLKIEFTGGSIEKGYLKQYPTAKGHLIAQSPDAIYMNILNPVTSSTVVTMASAQGRFQIWVPRENKYLTGSTHLQGQTDNPLYSVRPDHLLEAILIEPIPLNAPDSVRFIQEAQDAARKYYVIHLVRVGTMSSSCLERQLWIDRADLRLIRQNRYDCGKLLSTVQYGDTIEVGDWLLSQRITLRRLQEHYQLRLQLGEGVGINQVLKAGVFEVPRPRGAEWVEITDIKQQSTDEKNGDGMSPPQLQ